MEMKKIINTKKLEDLEVLTDSGWEDAINIHTTIIYERYILRTDNYELHCADNHIVFDEDYNEIFVINLKIGDRIFTKNGVETVLELHNTGIKETMYDLEIDSINHRYYTSGILSHNTTTSQIIAEKYDTLLIDCSQKKYRGIDVINDVIADHIKNFSISFGKKDKRKKGDVNGIKCVILEEFDKTTPDMRGALRGFIEEYPHVRFIANVNNELSISRNESDKALMSRFNKVQFDPQSKDEIDFLKTHQLKYLKAICVAVKFTASDDILNSLINRTFPNFRSTVQLLQEITLTGDLETYLKEKDTLNIDVFSYMMNGNNQVNQNFYYVADNYPKEKTEDLLNLLSRPFFKYLLENNEDIIYKNGMKILSLTKDYNAEYTTTIDPEMHLVSYITNLKDLLNI